MSLFYLTNLLHLNCKSVRKKDGDETLTKRQIARMLGIAPVTLYRIEKYQAEDLANVPP